MHSFYSLAQCKAILVLAPLALAGVLTGQQPAQAALTYYLYEESGNSYIEASGALALPPPFQQYQEKPSFPFGYYDNTPSVALAFRTGLSAPPPVFDFILNSPVPYPTIGFPLRDFNANTSSGLRNGFFTTIFDFSKFSIDSSYINNTPITSQSIFIGRSFGFTTPGLIGTWTIRGTTETINLVVGKPVPGPLPILGAGAAYGFSRRLRRRIRQGRGGASSAGLNG